VREVVFMGRAGDDRLEAFLAAFPDPASAATCKGKSRHEKRAHTIAKRFLKAGGTLPEESAAIQTITGAAAGVVQLIIAQTHGGTPPRSGTTLRVAERVSGVRRNGSLNGISHAVLARLVDFGDDPAVNQLLLDLGRSVCLPGEPLCGECPLRQGCAYRAAPNAREVLLSRAAAA
jgi:A/G-specific adenine glycosylase